MRKFLKFVHDDNVYCKYYEVVYILFHTGMCISEITLYIQGHLLFKYRKIRNEFKALAIPHGTFGYISYNECVYAHRI